jgi:hypothetical protein
MADSFCARVGDRAGAGLGGEGRCVRATEPEWGAALLARTWLTPPLPGSEEDFPRDRADMMSLGQGDEGLVAGRKEGRHYTTGTGTGAEQLTGTSPTYIHVSREGGSEGVGRRRR